MLYFQSSLIITRFSEPLIKVGKYNTTKSTRVKVSISVSFHFKCLSKTCNQQSTKSIKSRGKYNYQKTYCRFTASLNIRTTFSGEMNVKLPDLNYSVRLIE